MHQERSLSLDLIAIALFALVVFLGVALFSYSPADPLPSLVAPLNQLYRGDLLVYPVNPTTTNLCGTWGALASDLLFNAFGLGSYYLILSLAVFDAWLLLRRPVQLPMLRGTGWLFSLIGLTAIASLLIPGLSPGPVIGAGGYLGALACGFMETHFAMTGGLILAFSITIAGVLLCTDYAILRGTVTGFGMLQRGCQGLYSIRVNRVQRVKSQADDLDEGQGWEEDSDEEDEYEYEEDAEEVALPIRFQGKQKSNAANDVEAAQEEEEYDDEEYDEDEYESEEEGDEELVGEEEDVLEPASKGGNHSPDGNSFRTRVATALGITKQPETSREELMEELEAASQNNEPENYELPPVDLLLPGDDYCYDEQEKEVRRKAKILETTFESFGFQVKVVEVETGPVIAQYEVELEAGLRLSRITGLSDDLAIALRVPSVRIVAPIPGKNTVGIEVPNEQRQLVLLRDVMEELGPKTSKMRIPLFLGKDVSGNPLAVDLSGLPHLLIAGRTGTGKSVCLNAIISSILMTRRPDEVRMLMIDPKMVELSGYKTLPHLMHPVVTDMRKAEAILAWAVEKMEERYALLARAGVRHVSVYNQLGEQELMDRLEPETEDERQAIPLHLPFIVIVADEIADLMMTSGKEVEQHIIRLAQKSRAVGIHLILATQKPTVDVITGLIKSNLPARIAFQVASRTDSRVVLDEMGADKLLGNGDMLFLWPGTSTLLRGQGTYLSDDEIDRIVDYVSTGEQHFVQELIHMKVEENNDAQTDQIKKRDELYEAAVDIVINERRGSVSLLQRALGIGYGRAARLIDFMAEDGIVGTYAGSQAREVLLSAEQWAEMLNESQEQVPEKQQSLSVPSNKITAHIPVHTEMVDNLDDDEDLPVDTIVVDATSVKAVSKVSADSHEEQEIGSTDEDDRGNDIANQHQQITEEESGELEDDTDASLEEEELDEDDELEEAEEELEEDTDASLEEEEELDEEDDELEEAEEELEEDTDASLEEEALEEEEEEYEYEYVYEEGK